MRYTQNQMILPLMETLSESGGALSTGDICDAIAEKLAVPNAVREEKVRLGGSKPCDVKVFDRTVRWAQQTAKCMGLIEAAGRPYWRLKGNGEKALHEALPGTVLTIFTAPNGIAIFGSCEDAVAYIDDHSVQLLFTSLPYPLIKPRPYGNRDATTYVDWFLRIAEKWPRIMARDGSIVVNLGDVYEEGSPTISLYQERLLIRLHDELGLNLCQKFYWNSTTKLPLPKTWVAVRRVRVTNSVEQLFWLSSSDNPFASNREVLRPYSKRMIRTIASGGEKRHATYPSGHSLTHGAFARDNGGSIPGNLLSFPSYESNPEYARGCRASGLPIHPARFPAALPNFFIRFLTRPKDLVYDPCAGSGVTAQEADKLGRRWIISDIIREYIEGAINRIPAATPLGCRP